MRADAAPPTAPLFDDAPGRDAPVATMPPPEDVRLAAERCSRHLYLGPLGFGRPEWRGTIYTPGSGAARLRGLDGLRTLAAVSWFGCVSLERGYLHPYSLAEYSAFAMAVPDDFRFLVRAPSAVTSFFERDRRGRSVGVNPTFLNPEVSATFVRDASLGLGKKLAAVFFDVGPFPTPQMKTQAGRLAAMKRVEDFFMHLNALLAACETPRPVLALEVKNPTLLTPRLMGILRAARVRPVMGLNEGMPGLLRQMKALACCDAEKTEDQNWRLTGPLIIRWHKAGTMPPYGRVRDVATARDPVTQMLVATLAMRAVESGQSAYVLAGDDAEGSAPATLRAVLLAADRIRARRAEG